MVGVVARWCKWVSFLISFGGGWCTTAWYGSVSDDGTACPQFAKNGLLSRRTHMMTRNIVNILPLSLRSSHLTQDVERWNEEHPKKRTSTPTLNNFFWTERQMYYESFKLKEDVQMDFQFTELRRRWFAPFPPTKHSVWKKSKMSHVSKALLVFSNIYFTISQAKRATK